MKKLLTYLSNLLHMSTQEDQDRLRKVLLPTFIIQVSGLGLALLVSVIMTHGMGAANYGIYSYCFSIVVGIVNFIVYGINILAIRETSSLLALDKASQWKGFMKWNIKYLFISSIAVSVIAAIVFYFFPILPSDTYRIPVIIACSSIPLFSFLLLISSVLRGMHKVLLSQLAEKLVRPVSMLIMLIAVYLVFKHIGLKAALILNTAAFGIGMLYAVLKYRQHSGTLLQNLKTEYETSRWMKEVSGLFLFSILISIDTQIDIYMLGYLKPPAEVGIYKISNTAAQLTSFFLGISNVVLAPSFAHLHALQEKDKLQRLVTQTIRWVMLLTAPVALFIMIFSHWILSLWGPEFVAGQDALIMLCGAHLINSAFGSVGNLALMSKFEKYNGMAILLSIALNIILNLLLTPTWGINGTAFATGISLVIWNVMLYVVVKRKTGIRTWVFAAGTKES